MKHLITLLIASLFTPLMVKAQVKIGDNLTNVNANSILELESTTKALLLPRLNQTQIDAMQNVPAGMLVYNSTTNVLNIRTNSGWTTLALAANANSATNPFSTSGSVAYTTASKVGIGTSAPITQFANTSTNTIDSQGDGLGANSLSWAADQEGYVGQFFNNNFSPKGNGLLVKVNNSTATALEVAKNSQNGIAVPLVTVKASGKVGINNKNPKAALDVDGTITSTQIGVGTSSPVGQLANNSGNPTDFQGIGGNSNDSFSWASSGAAPSYVAQINNSGAGTARNGMLVKVHSTDATAFAVYQDNLSLITVKADQKVGINKASPTGTLDVNGNIVANRFDLGVQYVFEDHDTGGFTGYTYDVFYVGCPNGTKVIGGGGGHRDSNNAIGDIIVRYSGPNPQNPDTEWRLAVSNTYPLSPRVVRVYAICAKVNTVN